MRLCAVSYMPSQLERKASNFPFFQQPSSVFCLVLFYPQSSDHFCYSNIYTCVLARLGTWAFAAREDFYFKAFLKKRRGYYCNRLRQSVCPLCYLLLNHWTKLKQIWWVTHINGACNVKLFFLCRLTWGNATSRKITQPFFLPCPLGKGQKVKYHLISITKSISKIFIPSFVCVLTNERYKTYQTGFSFCHLGHAPGMGLWGVLGCLRGQTIFFSNMVMWHIKWKGMMSRTECK